MRDWLPTSPQDDAFFTGFAFPRVHLFQIFFQLSKSVAVSFDCCRKNNLGGLALICGAALFGLLVFKLLRLQLPRVYDDDPAKTLFSL